MQIEISTKISNTQTLVQFLFEIKFSNKKSINIIKQNLGHSSKICTCTYFVKKTSELNEQTHLAIFKLTVGKLPFN